MVDVQSLLVIAFTLSALYALIAIGFTMIFGIGGILNIAHGANITIAAFTGLYVSRLGVNMWIGAVIGVLVAGVFSVLTYLVLIRPVENDPVVVIIITLLVLLIVEQFFLNVFGSDPRSITALISGHTELVGFRAQNNQLLTFAVSWGLILGLIGFVNQTRIGKAIIALSMSDKGSMLVGIERLKVYIVTWFLAGVLAGMAGVFYGMFRTAHYSMGFEPLLLSFVIVVLGGVGSIKGSIIGAHIIGFLETVTVMTISARLTLVLPLIVLLIVLLVKPTGLYGRAGEH